MTPSFEQAPGPITTSYTGTQSASPVAMPTRPNFHRAATMAPGYSQGYSQETVAASPKAMKSFYIEPGSTAMYTMAASFLMMGFACWIPFYLGICMLFDKHYRMWIGWEHPALVVFLTFMMPVAFVGCIYVILRKGMPGSGVRSEETMVLVGATFTSLLGVTLCLLALPMSASSASVIQQLSFGCDLADPTSAKMVFYSQVLHNIRGSPECQTQGSVKDCAGFKSNKYTEYLQRLENDFDCTGLCTLPAPPTAAPAQITPEVAPHPHAGKVPTGQNQGATTGPQGLLLQSRTSTRLNQKSLAFFQTNSTKNVKNRQKTAMQELTSSGQLEQLKEFTVLEERGSKIPALKLFSNEKTDQRCYPLVADRLQVTSSTSGELLFWTGVGLLSVSILAGSVKVVDKTLFEK